MDFEDPPTPRAVVRGILGGATLVALVAVGVMSAASGHIDWKLVALVLILWSAYGFFDLVLGGLLEPLGRFLAGQFTGGDMPAARITIEEETASLERLLAGDAPPPAHRGIIAGIRLAEIYRTHEHDAAKADALIARLATQYPDAPELRYVRPPPPGPPAG